MKWVLLFAAVVVVCGCESQQEQAQVEEKLAVVAKKAKEVKPAQGEAVRPMVAAGQFYPADAAELRKAVEGYIKDAGKVKVAGEVVAVIAPHAGYVYSGPVAGYSYAALKGESFDTVVVVGSHIPDAGVSVLNLDYYQTPLGYVKVDTEVVKKLMEKEHFGFQPLRHREHAIETQVPFLQVALKGNFEIVAMAVTSFETEFVKKVAQDLAEALKGKRVLLVASTDLSHYPPYDAAKEVDGKIMESWKTLDGAKIAEREKQLMLEYADSYGLDCVMCGKAAVAIVVEAAKLLGADSIDLLKYANSGDVPAGGKEQVVGYGAAAIYKKGKKEETGELSKEAQQYLLNVAREAIKAMLSGKRMPKFEAKTQELKEKRGVFITLYKGGQLRGCIGCFASEDNLPTTVARFAVYSATQDSRFPPVTLEEVVQLTIKISVLSERRKVDSVDEIVLGRHGIWVVNPRTGRGGTYLPEVATELGWDRDEFLSHCCREKAGLPADSWKEGKVDIYVYTTQIFGEGK